ncbi:MAG: dihydrolipoamide acetyltransferase family protein [Betaproteobacteria bacterium]
MADPKQQGQHVVKVPDIGEGIAEAELVAWHVKAGDSVKEDQPLADVMTDKATVEIPSPVSGKVLALGGDVGQMLAVGGELVRIETGGKAEAKELVTETVAAPAVQQRKSMEKAVVHQLPSDRPIASPSVRRRAWELGVELKDVRPSGSAGRIMHADLDAHVAARGLAARKEMPQKEKAPEPGADQEVKITGLRRRIAQKMQESARRIPHFTYVEEVDVTELEALRGKLNAAHAGKPHLTLLPFIVRGIVAAVREFPEVNARFDDEAGVVTRSAAVHAGIATQTESGLMVPVLRHAERGDLWANAAEIARLAEAARAGRATRQELSGSTITITSLGALGGIMSTPIINHPEVAIVGVNRMLERGGRRVMNLSSSFDHRVVDGMNAARFIQALRAYLETPATLFI